MKTDAGEGFLVYGGRRIPYRLTRSDRKRLRLVVKPDLTVTAHAPRGFTDEQVREAIQSKARWVARQVDAFEEFHPLPTPHRYVSGETLTYLGRQYRLKVERGERAPAKLHGRYLHVVVPDKEDRVAIRRAVQRWYRGRAQQVLRRYLTRCMGVAGRHGVEEPMLVIRDMRTRWGSCSAAGRLTLNLKLVQAPVHCIEYVIMHELCHRVHHDHSAAFYRLLTRCLPDWERRREVLRGVVVSDGRTGE